MDQPPPAEFSERLRSALAGGTFRRLVLGKPRGGELRKAVAEFVQLADGVRLQWKHETHRQHFVRPTDAAGVLAEFAAQVPAALGSAHLFAGDGGWQLEFNKKDEPRLTRIRGATGAPPAPAPHDREKRRPLAPADAPWLKALGVAGDDGRVRAEMTAKFRQISRYIELLLPLAREAGLDRRETIRACDMGAGKGYLTFAAWHLLTRELGRTVQFTGVEARPELVALCNGVARGAGCAGLEFAAGTIVDFPLAECDALLALHACDTATDEAIFRGIRAGAALIIAAPCCQKELRPQLAAPAEFAPLTRHGIFAERTAEMLTDALRALLLESQGYRVKVFEFVSSEHTPRNTMLAAVKRATPDRAADERARSEYATLKAKFGLRHQRLEQLLGAFAPVAS